MLRRLTAAAVVAVAGGLIAGGVALAHVGPGAPTAATASQAASGTNGTAGQSVGTIPLSSGTQGSGTQGQQPAQPGGRGAWGGHGGFGPGGPAMRGRFGGMGRGVLTVSGVSGNTITASRGGSQAITVTVSETTAYTEAGASASLSDVQQGETIAVQGTRTGTDTIAATSVTIILPRELGVVTNVNGDTLTMTGFDGATHTVSVDSSTRYQKAGQSAALSDVTSGTAIVAEGKLNGDGSLNAVLITIQLPRLSGQVSAVSGSSITISGRGGNTYTVTTSSNTTYVNPDGTSASASAVKSGVGIVAEGTLSADGKTLSALRIVVLPASGMWHGGMGHAGRGFPGMGGPGVGGFGLGAGSPGVGGFSQGATSSGTTNGSI